MAENLNYKVNDGVQSFCFDGKAEYCSVGGRLYTWAASVGRTEAECGEGISCYLDASKNVNGELQGVCPDGWHIPVYSEWMTLKSNAETLGNAGQVLSSRTGWGVNSGDDNFGFGALPTGRRYSNGGYVSTGGFWWSLGGYSFYSYGTSAGISNSNDRSHGLSVRCVENAKACQTTLCRDTEGETCNSSNAGRTMNGKVNADSIYYCTGKSWVPMANWSWDVPLSARVNPDITYGTLTDSRDGHTYRTVQIGGQTWMAENLNYKVNDGVQSFCFDGKAEYCSVGGRLYTWAASVGRTEAECGEGISCYLDASKNVNGELQGVCPDGWHIPVYSEWMTLKSNAETLGNAGQVLSSRTGWGVNSGDDNFGFGALPTGRRYSNGGYVSTGGFWWSLGGYSFYSYGTSAGISNSNDRSHGLSVRCLKNKE
ncbi:major paralogous domain-containing protein [Fibrobacter sp. UWP2]|nr:major paralogous domain-containing protein [Fibrobacter sp. UWP2]